MADEQTYGFLELRGGQHEQAREEGDAPRSAASYCAQYGVPLEDIESELEEGRGHSDMLAFCERYARNEKFRERSLALLRNPMKKEEAMSENDRKRLEEFRTLARIGTEQAKRLQTAVKAGAFGQPGKAMPDVTIEEINAEEYRRGMEWTDR